MKKCIFQRCVRAVGSMTSAQRHAFSGCDRVAGQERPGGRGGLPGGNPHRLSSLTSPGDPAMGTGRRSAALPVPGSKRTFNALTGTPLASLHHKDRWMFFLDKFNEGESVRKAAWRCGINTEAAFLWRHRFLVLPGNLKARKESGLVETDETFFLRFYKEQRGGPENGADGPPNAGSPGNRFPSWPSGTGRVRPLMRSFRRMTIGRPSRSSDLFGLGMRSSVPTEEERAPSHWPPGR